jgi:hypothetical protein
MQVVNEAIDHVASNLPERCEGTTRAVNRVAVSATSAKSAAALECAVAVSAFVRGCSWFGWFPLIRHGPFLSAAYSLIWIQPWRPDEPDHRIGVTLS